MTSSRSLHRQFLPSAKSWTTANTVLNSRSVKRKPKRISVRFKGRELGHPEHGLEIMRKFAEALAEVAVVEKPAKLEGRSMMMFLAAKPNK